VRIGEHTPRDLYVTDAPIETLAGQAHEANGCSHGSSCALPQVHVANAHDQSYHEPKSPPQQPAVQESDRDRESAGELVREHTLHDGRAVDRGTRKPADRASRRPVRPSCSPAS
jgi:hypothetical protein